MDDRDAIAAIRQAIEVGDFEIDRRHCDAHIYDEGFTFRQALSVTLHGRVIEAAESRNRWLFCDTIRGLRQDPRFRGQWLHVSVERNDESAVMVVTMYRPTVQEWRTGTDRG